MSLLSYTVARTYGITDEPEGPWNYLYDLLRERWVYIGPPASPREIMHHFSQVTEGPN
jgi:hypothetical protein